MSTSGKISKRAATADNEGETETPSKRARSDEERKSTLTTPGLSKLGGLNGINRRQDKHDKPDELFRKDLISAMKLPDAEQLEPDTYVTIQDQWRQEWERGVQVPVHQTLKTINLRVVPENEFMYGTYGFKMPKKMLYAVKDENYESSIHELHETQKLAEQVCRYDLDDLDVTWLRNYNDHRELLGEQSVEEWLMEKIMEELETQCYNNMQIKIKTVEGLGIEYDENVVCDVCRSPEGEDGNEMVFCDACDICVHQACYGVNSIPEGSWLCRTCAIGVTPKCILCPKLGGAMKSTKSGSKWAHVACALWIPEVSIGCPEKMEPVCKVSQIPASRWALVCSFCRIKEGACIQCAVKTCKTAFHVTCAFSNNLDMKTILDEDEEDVQLKAYCPKHSKKSGEMTPKKGDGTPGSPQKKESEMTEEEKTELRSHRLAKLAEEFYSCVESIPVARALKLEDEDMVDHITNYWVLKRKANFNKPLLTPKTEEADLLSKQREDSLIARMKMFIHLRQDLERVRNLCYMVSRREKTRRQLYRLKEDIFHKQVEVIADPSTQADEGSQIYQHIIEAHKLDVSDSVYDQYDAILQAADASLFRAQQQDDAASIAGSLDDNGSIKPEIHSRRPSLESSEDEDFTEQSQEDYKARKNRSLLGFKKAKLANDRKENARRKALEQEMQRKLEEKSKSLGLIVPKSEADNEEMEETEAGRAVSPCSKGSPRGRSPAIGGNDSRSRPTTPAPKTPKTGVGKEPRNKSPATGGKGKNKMGKRIEEVSQAERAGDKRIKNLPVEKAAKNTEKKSDKKSTHGKEEASKGDEISNTVGGNKCNEEDRLKDGDKNDINKNSDGKKCELDKVNEASCKNANIVHASSRTEGKDKVDVEKRSRGRPPKHKKSFDSCSFGSPKSYVDTKEKNGNALKTSDSELSSKKRKLENISVKSPAECLKYSGDSKEKTVLRTTRARSDTLKPGVADFGPGELDSVDVTLSRNLSSDNTATIDSGKIDSDIPTKDSKSRRLSEGIVSEKERTITKEMKENSVCDTTPVVHRGRGRPRKSISTPRPETPQSEEILEGDPTSSKDNSESKKKPVKHIEKVKGKDAKECNENKLKDTMESDCHDKHDVADDINNTPRKKIPVLDLGKEMSPEIPVISKSRSRSLRSLTPLSTRSATPIHESSVRSLRSATPLMDESEPCSGDLPQTKAQELDHQCDIDESSQDSVVKQPRISLRRCRSPTISALQDSKLSKDSSKIAKSEPAVDLSQLKDESIGGERSPKTHNLRVKDQNRPSPKSYKDKLALKLAQNTAKDNNNETVSFNGFTFNKSALCVPQHIKEKVHAGFMKLRHDRNAQVPTYIEVAKANIRRQSTGIDRKENKPSRSPGLMSRKFTEKGSPISRESPELRRKSLRSHSDSDPESFHGEGDLSPRASPVLRTRKSQGLTRIAVERRLGQKLLGGGDTCESEIEVDVDSDVDSWDPSESDRNSRRRSSRLSKPADLDEDSQMSVASNTSRYSTRSTRLSADSVTKCSNS